MPGKQPGQCRCEHATAAQARTPGALHREPRSAGLGARRGGPARPAGIIPITSGHFEGPGFKGKILDNGADWQLVDSNGLAIIDTRYLLQTDDGALVYLQTKGFRHGPAEVLRKVANGEPVDPSQYYFRITLQFETSDPRYSWLNGMVGVGSAMRLQKTVIYDGFIVK